MTSQPSQAVPLCQFSQPVWEVLRYHQFHSATCSQMFRIQGAPARRCHIKARPNRNKTKGLGFDARRVNVGLSCRSSSQLAAVSLKTFHISSEMFPEGRSRKKLLGWEEKRVQGNFCTSSCLLLRQRDNRKCCFNINWNLEWAAHRNPFFSPIRWCRGSVRMRKQQMRRALRVFSSAWAALTLGSGKPFDLEKGCKLLSIEGKLI